MCPTADPCTATAGPIAIDRPANRLPVLAVRALHAELVTFPKPGLVSLVDTGSHVDMDASTFVRSAFSLRHYFSRIAAAGRDGAAFPALRRLGVEAEARMARATGGVNTHRGAIFHLGLLVAAAAAAAAPAEVAAPGSLGDVVRRFWGPALATHRRDPASHGSRAGARYAAGGAVAEAHGGYPSIFAIALPALCTVLDAGGSPAQARVQAFFALLARVDDTNLLHRGGGDALAHAQRAGRAFLDSGGVLVSGWRDRAQAAHVDFCRRGLSPGGSADLLAATLFVHSLSS